MVVNTNVKHPPPEGLAIVLREESLRMIRVLAWVSLIRIYLNFQCNPQFRSINNCRFRSKKICSIRKFVYSNFSEINRLTDLFLRRSGRMFRVGFLRAVVREHRRLVHVSLRVRLHSSRAKQVSRPEHFGLGASACAGSRGVAVERGRRR